MPYTYSVYIHVIAHNFLRVETKGLSMAEILDDVDYLAQEVGPHPAGTEEEQRAALYIADRLQKDAGFTTVVEDFQCLSNDQLPRLICYGVALLAVLLSLILPGLGLLWLLFAIAAAVFFGLEITGRPVLSKLFRVGASQNVVAKYQPAATGAPARRRKIILVANYDSGKVLQEEKPPIAGFLPILQKASAIALVVSAFLLLLRNLLFAGDTGAISSVLSFFLVICAILFVLPIVRCVLHLVAPFNQGANNNATGTAVLLDVARKVGKGLVSNEELMAQAAENGSTVHGEEAAAAAGVVPEGATVSYDAELNPQESLAAAKAAIAALTGRPVADKVPVTDISAHLVKGGGLDPEDEASSGVHFEESPVKPARAPRAQSPLARTMVSSVEEEPAQAEVAPVAASGQDAVEEAAAQEAEAQPAAVEAAEPAAEPEASTFQRSIPAALTGATGFTASTGSTPAWAKKAQEKARANKPEVEAPKRAFRSRYADAPAAQMADSQRAANPFAGSAADSVEEQPVEETELSARLKTMREEIESAEAPKFAETAAPQVSEPAATTAAAEAPVAEAAPAPAEGPADAASVATEPAFAAEAEPEVAAKPQVEEPVSRETAPEKPAASADEEALREATSQAAEPAEAPHQRTSRATAHKPHKIHGIAADLHAAREAEREAFDVHEENEAKAAAAKAEAAKVADQQSAPVEAEPATEAAAETAPMGVVDEETVSAAETGEMPVAAPSNRIDSYVEQAVSGTDEMETESAAPAAAPRPRRRSVSEPSGFAHSFASRLKSITGRKPSFLQRNEEPEDEYYAEDGFVEDGYVEDQTANVGEFYEDDYYEGEDYYDEPEQGEAAAPANMTAAMPPIDVSQFMDNEEFDDEAEPVRHLNEVAERVTVAYDEDDLEATQPVPAVGSQDAFGDSYSYDYENANFQPEEGEPDDFSAAQPTVASPILGMENMVPSIDVPEVETKEDGPARQVIVLPDVITAHAPTGEETRQRAPMAEVSENGQAGNRALLSNMLPSIGNTGAFDAVDGGPASLDLPGFDDAPANQAVSTTGSFATVGGTGAFAPVTDELVSDLPPEEVYVDDADDSAYDVEYTETGAFAGPGYVDMPKSRAGRLFGKFRKKNKQPEVSVSDWVDVDESYNARSVGQARGDWSSFRQDDGAAEQPANDGFVDVNYNQDDNNRGWNGGAFSLDRLRKGQKREDAAAPADEFVPEDLAAGYDDAYVDESPAVRIDGDGETAAQINNELRKLQDFRHPDINTEVWFVALGAEQYGHCGINAFLDEHAAELRGAIVVNLEALGAGTLSCIEQEGAYQPRKISSRLKRILRQAGEKSGVRFNMDVIASRETAAGVAMSRGVQAITIAGMAEGNTALYSADNDIIENVDEKALEDASNFVMAMLKSI